MITFGLSAPSKKVQIEKGFTVDAVTAAARPGRWQSDGPSEAIHIGRKGPLDCGCERMYIRRMKRMSTTSIPFHYGHDGVFEAWKTKPPCVEKLP